LMMGMPFALGMRLAATRPGATTAFMWGINGAMSVCGSVFGLVLALFFGISTAFWVGLLAYALAFAAMTRMAPPRGEPSTVVSIAGEPQPVAVPAPCTVSDACGTRDRVPEEPGGEPDQPAVREQLHPPAPRADADELQHAVQEGTCGAG